MKSITNIVIVIIALATILGVDLSPAFSLNIDCKRIGYDAGLKGIEEYMVRNMAEDHYRDSQDCIIEGYRDGLNYAKAERAYKNKEYGKALSLFLTNAQKGYVDAQARTGELYFNGLGTEQDYKEGVKWYALAAAQGNVNALFHLGTAYKKGLGTDKDLEKAIGAFQKTVERDPRRANAWAYLALCYKEKGDYGPASESIQRALALSPENIEFSQVQASVYLLQGDAKNTKKSYENLLTLLKSDIEKEKTAAKCAKASWYSLLASHFSEAERYANEGLSLDAKLDELHAYLGHAYLFQNSKREAFLIYKKYIELDPDQAARRNKLNEDFAILKKRYPENVSLVEWIENKMRTSDQ